jgi:ribonuclease E
MAKLTISVELDTNDANDLVIGSKLSEVLDVLEAGTTKTTAKATAPSKAEEDAPEEKPKRKRRSAAEIEADKKAAAKAKAEEEEEEEAPKSSRRGSASTTAKKRDGDDLEAIMDEGRAIMAKVIEDFRDDVKAEFKYYGVKTISDFKDKEDLLEFIDFLKELESELGEAEEEEEEEAPRRRRR